MRETCYCELYEEKKWKHGKEQIWNRQKKSKQEVQSNENQAWTDEEKMESRVR